MIEDRTGRRSTIVTSQLPVGHWHEALGEPTIADAILDRLVHNAYRLELRGDSLRRDVVTGDGGKGILAAMRRQASYRNGGASTLLTAVRDYTQTIDEEVTSGGKRYLASAAYAASDRGDRKLRTD